MRQWALLLLLVSALACRRSPVPVPAAAVPTPPAAAEALATATSAPEPAGWARLPRETFNRLAAAHFLPLFWRDDANHDRTLQPNELVVLTGISDEPARRWLADGRFQPGFEQAYETLVQRHRDGWQLDPTAPMPEQRRRAAVLRELEQGRPTLLQADLRGLSDGERAMVRRLLIVARQIEHLYARQTGTEDLPVQIADDDLASQALFRRNQGPWCVAPATEADADCNALTTHPPKLSGLYPSGLQMEPNFCALLRARPDAEQLLAPFVAVRDDGQGGLRAVPYHEAFGQEMREVARELDAAALALPATEETALRSYLQAAAQAFRTNDWLPADEAWAKMNASNSKWYLRVGPDETYFEPCARKAGFHLQLARIDAGSLKWQALLDPLKNAMEQALAAKAGSPYVARQVSFQLPDFIQVVLNAGESRAPLGATIGQSLPNWGPVANEGRGRTVAMVNIGSDADSRHVLEAHADDLLCTATRARFSSDPVHLLMSTVLHEAAHNLGPAHEYQVDGKADGVVFGGPLAAMLEELKAQTAAMWLADWLAKGGHITAQQAADAHLADLLWAMGHVANGLVDAQGRPKAYSQLAAIQLGTLREAGALQWRGAQKAANGRDTGCFELDEAKLAPAVDRLMARVAGIKARGDKADAEAMQQAYTTDAGEDAPWRGTIRERWLRAAKASYVYAVEL
jgi:hypothetical protein